MTDSSTNAARFVRRWWVVLLRGVAALAFGVLAFAWPHLTLATLVSLFGYFALLYGLFSFVGAITNKRRDRNRWLLGLEGIVGLTAGIVTLRTPSTTVMVLMLLVCPWAIATGVLRIVEAIRLREKISGAIWLVLSGIVTLIFAMVLILRPVSGVAELGWIIAGYAVLLGLLEILLGIDLRTIGSPRFAA
jgi:uncharacterized membrane protein HdeD (DUF308 family)